MTSGVLLVVNMSRSFWNHSKSRCTFGFSKRPNMFSNHYFFLHTCSIIPIKAFRRLGFPCDGSPKNTVGHYKHINLKNIAATTWIFFNFCKPNLMFPPPKNLTLWEPKVQIATAPATTMKLFQFSSLSIMVSSKGMLQI